jgi:hypothetical protein
MAINQPQQTNTPPPTATGFTNLNQYLSANQNNQLGNTVAGGIEQAGTNATNALGAANNTFQTGVNAEQNRQAALGQGVSTTLGNVAGGNYTVQPSDTTTFQNALSGQSQGPTGLNNAGQLQQQAQSAQALGQSASTPAGQYGLLQNFVGQGQQYGLGQQTLDSALLGATGGQQLGQARQATANLGGQVNQAIASANAQGTGLQNSAQQLATNTQNQLGSAVTTYNQQLAQQLAAAQANTNAAVTALGNNNSNTALNLSPTELQQLSAASGGVLSQGTNLYNTSLAPYVTANTQYANNADIQTQQQMAQAQALQQLAGSNGLTGNNAALLQSDVANPQAAGSYLANNPFAVNNQAALSQAIAANANQYNSQLAQQQYIINNAQNTGIGGSGNGLQDIGLGTLQGMAASTANGGTVAGTGPGGSQYGSGDIQAAIAANQAQQAAANQAITQAGQQFDINRILGLTPNTAPALNGAPVMGNGGQPLTSV